jgi:hypothetical protein
MFSYEFLGPLGSRYIRNPVVEHLVMIEDLEYGIIGSPLHFVGKQGEVFTAIADYQMLREAAV